MTDGEKIAVIQEHIQGLREEAKSNVESKRKLFQWVVIGVAGAVALRKDIEISDLHAFLPFVPILAMIIVALWLTETGFSFRCGRWLSLAERRINELAGQELVSYEQELLLWRRRAFTRYRSARIAGYLIVSVVYIWAVMYLMSASELRHYSGFTVVVFALAAGSNLVALIQVFRVYYELRPMSEADLAAKGFGDAAPNPSLKRTDTALSRGPAASAWHVMCLAELTLLTETMVRQRVACALKANRRGTLRESLSSSGRPRLRLVLGRSCFCRREWPSSPGRVRGRR